MATNNRWSTLTDKGKTDLTKRLGKVLAAFEKDEQVTIDEIFDDGFMPVKLNDLIERKICGALKIELEAHLNPPMVNQRPKNAQEVTDEVMILLSGQSVREQNQVLAYVLQSLTTKRTTHVKNVERDLAAMQDNHTNAVRSQESLKAILDGQMEKLYFQ